MENIEQESSVIYSFKGKWLDRLKAGQVQVFFRKRMPREKPCRVYLYVGSPVSAIIGWADAIELFKADPNHAMQLTSEGAIDPDELGDYLKDAQSVGVIRLGRPHLFQRPLEISRVRRVFNFHPPQNFVQISGNDARKLDELAQ